jgi:hypothetical protein
MFSSAVALDMAIYSCPCFNVLELTLLLVVVAVTTFHTCRVVIKTMEAPLKIAHKRRINQYSDNIFD